MRPPSSLLYHNLNEVVFVVPNLTRARLQIHPNPTFKLTPGPLAIALGVSLALWGLVGALGYGAWWFLAGGVR